MNKHAAPTTDTSALPPQSRPNSFVPQKAMYWYDTICDDMFANPGTSIKDTAARLGRSPVTVGYIVNSDLFKARYAQRRDQFNEELDTRLVGKLAKVAELSLDLTLESLEKKRTAVPLPLLHEVSDKALARLGYGPKHNEGAAVAVTLNTQNNTVAIPAAVSPEALREARATLRTIENGRVATASHVTRQLEPSSGSGTGEVRPQAPEVAAASEGDGLDAL